MNPSTALTRVLVDELVRGGLREAVLAPGSRSAPLAMALHEADRAGRLRLHVRIDERSAGFLALGLAKASGDPVCVVTTSGTATVNLHPAVLEASHSGAPLVVLTADRPPELRGTGANQAVDQLRLYGDAVRLFAEVGAPGERAGDNAYWRSLVCRALSAALGALSGAPGPVQLNVGLREPLLPDGDEQWIEPLDGRSGGAPWTEVVRTAAPGALTWPRLPRQDAAGVGEARRTAAAAPADDVDTPASAAPADDLPGRTLVVLADGPPAHAAAALRLAEARGFPVIAEPSAGARDCPNVVAACELVLSSPFLQRHRPERVLVVGRPTLSRAVGRLLASAPCDVVATLASWPDTSRTAARVLPDVPAARSRPPADGWLAGWTSAGARAAALVSGAAKGWGELAVAAGVAAAADGLLVVGSSKPVRDLLLVGPAPGARVLANRGVAGIDGMVSTAIGMALSHQAAGGGPAHALLGDLTFLHDANGLVLGPGDPRPDLTIVVVNNDGGAIFGLLEQGSPAHADAFERLFGTPHGVDLAALCAATGTPFARVTNAGQLGAALEPAPGLRVVEARTDRQAAVGADRELRAAAARELT